MKKHPYISSIAAIAGAFVLAVPLITSAQTVIDTEAATGIGQSMDAGPAAGSVKLRDTLKQKIQQNYQTYEDRMRTNGDARNVLLEKRSEKTPTTTMRGQMGGSQSTTTRFVPPEFMRKLASSTEKEIRGHVQAVRMAVFTAIRGRLVAQLTHALDNLKQIRARISARITLETANGKDMSSSTSLLAVADGKITLADQAVQALKVYVPTATTTVQADASATIELGKPREIGTDAIRAVNDARKALSNVVVAIARALGITLSTSTSRE